MLTKSQTITLESTSDKYCKMSQQTCEKEGGGILIPRKILIQKLMKKHVIERDNMRSIKETEHSKHCHSKTQRGSREQKKHTINSIEVQNLPLNNHLRCHLACL